MEKIEKLKNNLLVNKQNELTSGIEPATREQMHEKINEIIDRLEELQDEKPKVFTEFSEEKHTREDIPRGCIGIGGDLYKIEDTTEEWEEKEKDIWYMVGGKKYVSINGEEYVRTSDTEQELDKAREEGRREVFSQEELKILMWLVRDRKQGIDWNYKTKRISEWDKLVSDGLFNKLEELNKLKQ